MTIGEASTGGVIEIRNRRPRVADRSMLTERDRVVIEIERTYGSSPEALPLKLEHAQRVLGLSPGAYHLVLRSLIEDSNAYAEAPDVIERLRTLCQKRLG